LNIDACTRRTVIILDFPGTRDGIAYTGYFALYLAANVEYKADGFVGEPPIAAEIRSIEY
jgi:hypothetical protein